MRALALFIALTVVSAVGINLAVQEPEFMAGALFGSALTVAGLAVYVALFGEKDE